MSEKVSGRCLLAQRSRSAWESLVTAMTTNGVESNGCRWRFFSFSIPLFSLLFGGKLFFPDDVHRHDQSEQCLPGGVENEKKQHLRNFFSQTFLTRRDRLAQLGKVSVAKRNSKVFFENLFGIS